MCRSREKHWPGDNAVNPSKLIWSKSKTDLG